MTSVVLDTNAYSRLLQGDTDILDALAGADTVYMSIFVLGELFTGFKGGNREKENIKTLDNFLSKPTVKILDGTEKTSTIFARLKHDLKKAGTPLPINDVWIAAHTIETDSRLITFDSHFDKIPSLSI